MKYQLEITSSAEKVLRKYAAKLQERIIDKISKLSHHPRPFGSKKLRGSKDYRTRIGDYRIIYSIDDNKKVIAILDIGHRKDIYR